ncbi:M15 family metallopeptidase [Cyclobacterium sp. 1_MG-2023]|uniref:M15 family metallopeptidase n=1 Tax=Cyclobacterium sp. 1_MG-2023 TaxID=3062681 RepID=UPI0026E2030C|nr:M15 family metallopeptidase [Cyclobacterium sp. 1_MG-2023]MDO6438098.1 M15 family metallopeptidase [Cyclobacterium sp. 1_MG-2023]
MIKTITSGIIALSLMACGKGKNETSEQSAKMSLPKIESIDSLKADPFQKDSIPFVGELEHRLIKAGLLNVQKEIPGIYVDLRYSTNNNFFGKDVYGELTNCYLQPEVIEMLIMAHNALQKSHPSLTFLIYDGVRPQSVQQILWDELDKPDSIKPLYVANPQKGSLHNFGVAVDLTLAKSSNGEALDMGTDFDFFGYPAYPDREEQMLKEGKINQKQVENRQLLREIMTEAGFKGIGSEWWHFNAYSRKIAGEKFDIVK